MDEGYNYKWKVGAIFNVPQSLWARGSRVRHGEPDERSIIDMETSPTPQYDEDGE